MGLKGKIGFFIFKVDEIFHFLYKYYAKIKLREQKLIKRPPLKKILFWGHGSLMVL